MLAPLSARKTWSRIRPSSSYRWTLSRGKVASMTSTASAAVAAASLALSAPPMHSRNRPGTETVMAAKSGSHAMRGHRQDPGQLHRQLLPRLAAVVRGVDLTHGGAEHHAADVARVARHGAPQHVDELRFTRQAGADVLPALAGVARTEHAQPPVGHVPSLVALQRGHEEFAGATRDEREAEVAWQAGLDRVPALCGVGGAEDSPVELHVEGVRSARVERDAVHAPVDADTVPTR